LKKGTLQARIFICYNALTDPLASRDLQGFCLPEQVDVEKVPCLGKIDPRYLLRAFEGGCDAVCLVGCPVGKCRTMDGNLRAQKRVAFVREILEEIGLNAERVFLYLREPMKMQEAQELMREFVSAARVLGASELRAEKSERSE
jgi:F420-non-reducing hydrogenase iron-sulfur subunit